MKPDHYRLLGIEHHAGVFEIERAYFMLMAQLDAYFDDDSLLYLHLRVARQTLRDPVSRMSYDKAHRVQNISPRLAAWAVTGRSFSPIHQGNVQLIEKIGQEQRRALGCTLAALSPLIVVAVFFLLAR